MTLRKEWKKKKKFKKILDEKTGKVVLAVFTGGQVGVPDAIKQDAVLLSLVR